MAPQTVSAATAGPRHRCPGAARRLLLAAAILAGLAGCGELPDLGDRITPGARNAAWPSLVPLGPLTAAASEDLDITRAAADRIAARARALRDRARQLRATAPLSPADRRRLAAAIARHAK